MDADRHRHPHGYRRILILAEPGQLDVVLSRAANLSRQDDTAILVAHLIDLSRFNARDGVQPEDLALQKAPAARRWLDLQLARHHLAWAESRVLWGDPIRLLKNLRRDWRPDLLLAGAESIPAGARQDLDCLSIPSNRSLRQPLRGLIERHPVAVG